MSAILTVPTLELLRIWSELEQAYHNEHGYGGDTAEIYAYRLQRRNPIRENARDEYREKAEEEAGAEAADVLYDICALFAAERECEIEIDGYALSAWMGPLVHRAHVRVIPNP